MKNRAVRAALFLLVLLAFAGAGYEVALLDRQAAGIREAVRAFDEKALQVETALLELRSAQFAYVATGQGPAFWTARASTLLAAVGDRLRQLVGLEKSALAAGIQPEGPSCSTTLDEFATLQRIDATVQGYVRDNQPLLASDLVFNDLREAGQVIVARVQEARRVMSAAATPAVEPIRRKQAATAGGAAVFAILVMILLVPRAELRKAAADATDPSRAERPAQPPEPSRLIPRPPVQADAAASAGRDRGRPWPDVPPREAGSAAPVAGAAAVPREVDLAAAAALCSDFARVHESAQLPGLLERLARLLDAAGVVIWVHDRTNAILRPALSCGYPAQALARIRSISTDDDSVTACAYREQKLRVVLSDGKGNGAIATPLVGTEGCVGVMAVETRHGAEREPNVQAIATIVAAQLATFVAPAEQSPPS